MAFRPGFFAAIALFVLGELLPAQPARGQPSEPLRRPTVALVLSGGGARGFAHIGVLKVIQQIGIPIDLIVGTSMGSIVGGLYAAGYSPDQLQSLSARINWWELFSDAIPRRGYSFAEQSEEERLLGSVSFGHKGIILSKGLVSGNGVLSLLSCLALPVADIRDFRNLPTSFCAVAVDIANGDEVHLSSGSLALALRASMSAPGVFAPIEVDGRLLVDGGVLNNLPVDVARQLGADIVIAVDITSPLAKADKLNDTVSVLRQMLKVETSRTTRQHRQEATLLISPHLGSAGFASFSRASEIIADGERAAEASRPELEALAEKLKSYPSAAGPSTVRKSHYAMQVHFADVAVSGASPRDEQYVRRAISGAGAAGVDPMVLFRLARELRDTGRYRSVTYDLTGRTPEARVLHVRFLPVEKDSAVVGAGLRFLFLSSDELSTGLAAHLAVILNNLPTSSASLLTDLYLGNTTGAELQYRFNLAGPLYLAPDVFAGHSLHADRVGQVSVGQQRVTRAGGSLALGVRPTAVLDLSAGYGIAWSALAPFVGGSYADPIASGRDGFLFAQLLLDTRDALPLPEHGVMLRAQYHYVGPGIGADREYQFLTGDLSSYLTFLDRNTVSLGAAAGVSFRTELPPDRLFGFGGSELFPGYAPDELRTANYGVGMVEYRFRLVAVQKELPTEIPFGVYLFVRGNIGTVWDTAGSFDPASNMLLAASGGIVGVTPLGVVRAELWTSDRTPFAVFVSIGTRILPENGTSPF
ncbi:MAG TPA: patatin-like phospholipase family protein [Spirochaetia bacterium]|nr:patatin-like phospholipase family protein [Spirochaetia bacterium]